MQSVQYVQPRILESAFYTTSISTPISVTYALFVGYILYTLVRKYLEYQVRKSPMSRVDPY